MLDSQVHELLIYYLEVHAKSFICLAFHMTRVYWTRKVYLLLILVLIGANLNILYPDESKRLNRLILI